MSMTYKQIGDELGITEDDARNIAERAIKKLKAAKGSNAIQAFLADNDEEWRSTDFLNTVLLDVEEEHWAGISIDFAGDE